jgi:hypothetical protein
MDFGRLSTHAPTSFDMVVERRGVTINDIALKDVTDDAEVFIRRTATQQCQAEIHGVHINPGTDASRVNLHFGAAGVTVTIVGVPAWFAEELGTLQVLPPRPA